MWGAAIRCWEASGTCVRDVLAAWLPLRVLARGQCAQSHYFKASLVLVALGSGTYEIVVRRSFADYFCRIMPDAAVLLLCGTPVGAVPVGPTDLRKRTDRALPR